MNTGPIRALFDQIANLEFATLFGIVFAAFVVKNLTGFGNTLIVNGGFSLLKENRFTSPVELIWNVPANLWMVWKDRRHLDFPLILPICLFIGIGELIGARLLRIAGDAALRSVLGLILIALGAEMLFNRRTFKPKPWISHCVSLSSGVLLGLFGVGALTAAWLTKLSAGRERYRSNICFIFLFDNLYRTALYGATGLLNTGTLTFSFFLFPAVVIGMAAGRLIDRRLDADGVRRLVVVLLTASGALLVIRFRFGF